MWDWVKSAASSAASWVAENKGAIASTVAAVVVGTLVTVAVGAFLVGTGGLGGVAIAVLAGAAGGAAGGAVGYSVDTALDPKKTFSAAGLAKAAIVGGIIGGLTGGVAKGLSGVGSSAAQAGEQTVAQAAGQGVEQATLKQAVQATAKRVAINAAAGAGVGGGTQLAENAVENVAEGRSVGHDIWRGVPQATGVGAGVGAGSALLEPLAKPILEKVAGRAIKAGARTAKAARQVRQWAFGGEPTATAPETPVEVPSETAAARPATGASPATHADAPVPEARGPPEAQAPERVEDGIQQALERGEVREGEGGARDGSAWGSGEAAGSADKAAGQGSSGESAANAKPAASEPAAGEHASRGGSRRPEPGAFGEGEESAPVREETASAAAAPVEDCANHATEGTLSEIGVGKTRAEVDAAFAEAKRVNRLNSAQDVANAISADEHATTNTTSTPKGQPVTVSTQTGEVAAAVEILTGSSPRMRGDLSPNGLATWAKNNVKMGGKFIVGGRDAAGRIGHYVSGRLTPEGIVFSDYQQAAKGGPLNSPEFGARYEEYNAIVPTSETLPAGGR